MEQNTAVGLFLALGIVIVAARLAGSLARRFDQPRVLGELIVGVLLGPSLLDILHSSALGLEKAHLDETIHSLAELGVVLLMFKIGLDIHIRELAKVGRVAFTAGVAGALVPVILTVPAVLLAGLGFKPALFAGVTLAATSVSISAQVLLELGVLQTKVGNALLASALIDDVVAILLVSFTAAITISAEGAHAGDLLGILARMLIYLAGAFTTAWFLLHHLIHWIHLQPAIAQSYGVQAVALVLALLFGWAAEVFGGVAAISGAFIAGVGLSRVNEPIKRLIDVTTSNMAYAFLVPIFFVSVGLTIDLHLFPLSALPFVAVLLLIAIASKVVGCGLGAYSSGFSRTESLRLGVCMISRGEVGLIVAALGVNSGVFQPDSPLFGALFLVVLLTTVLTPPMVRRVFQSGRTPEGEDSHVRT
jgi:Kef-type K+ transport system membrane component KefB